MEKEHTHDDIVSLLASEFGLDRPALTPMETFLNLFMARHLPNLVYALRYETTKFRYLKANYPHQLKFKESEYAGAIIEFWLLCHLGPWFETANPNRLDLGDTIAAIRTDKRFLDELKKSNATLLTKPAT